ncbi:DUF4124 domain-containing protein [Marinicella rhabdoformis]|uniref:DUF4124 domain-containing protein n=1 Tax=Marinicella rhabdoformis TaxID=2580566 RepID=UPI0012AEBB56|nr:DUF4124 domain-containing protein [Marinicella rhabdoformis]
MRKGIVLSLLMSSLMISTGMAGKLYKWVDEDGNVTYSDKVPPEQNKLAREELNDQGVVKEKTNRDLTPEEKKAKAAELKKARELAEQQRLEAIRLEKERNAILKSYTSEDQIIRLKGERLDSLYRNIEMAEDNLVIQQRNHEDLLKRAADRERNGQTVSKVFLDQIEKIKGQIEYQKQFIIDKKAEVETTTIKYDNELAKFKKYTGVEENESSE